MGSPLLTLAQTAFGELGLDEPTALANGGDGVAAALMFRVANRVGRALATAKDWSFLTVEGALVTTINGVEIYDLPADFDRLVFGTTWDRTNKWLVLGPDDPQIARARREAIFQAGPRVAIRQVGSTITVWPVPAVDGGLIAFDYVSANWASSKEAVAQPAFLADDDTCLFPDDLMVLGMKWRWMTAKGMEATMLKAEYDAELRVAFARDQGGGRALDLAAGSRRHDDLGNGDGFVSGTPAVTLGTSGGQGIGID